MHDAGAALRELAARAGLGGVRGRALLAVGVVCALAVGWWALPRGQDEAFFAESSIAVDGSAAASASAEPDQGIDAASVEPTGAIVHVAGAVRAPGVYVLSLPARVDDGVRAAGGALGNAALSSVNLARHVQDGEQIYIPTLDEIASGWTGDGGPAASASEGGGSVVASDGKINLNTADATQLEQLPGIGPATATKIIADRETNGPFAAPEDLQRVAGIGPKKFEALAELVTVR